ncbi:MAG: hypothetical protein QF896_02305 [Acidimicrobiales bacterium]|nr:hypothetical protein [Acidimicrobiales bacterium]|tara:strand:- start:2079 stop:2441 length:363 start_codon:yes stop_codon:yes gene_type:complete
MAGYDPQARRARPSVTDDSPVDDLLGQVPLKPVEQAAGGPVVPEPVGAAVEDLSPDGEVTAGEASAGGGTPSGTDPRPPFDTPLVEMTDENADRLRRLAVLGAVIAFVLMLSARRRRSRR